MTRDSGSLSPRAGRKQANFGKSRKKSDFPSQAAFGGPLEAVYCEKKAGCGPKTAPGREFLWLPGEWPGVPCGLVIADRQAVSPSTQPLIRCVVHGLADEVDAAVAEHELSPLRVARTETPGVVPVALGHAVGHARDAVIRITLIGGFLLAAGASGENVERHRGAGFTVPNGVHTPPATIPVIMAFANRLADEDGIRSAVTNRSEIHAALDSQTVKNSGELILAGRVAVILVIGRQSFAPNDRPCVGIRTVENIARTIG